MFRCFWCRKLKQWKKNPPQSTSSPIPGSTCCSTVLPNCQMEQSFTLTVQCVTPPATEQISQVNFLRLTLSLLYESETVSYGSSQTRFAERCNLKNNARLYLLFVSIQHLNKNASLKLIGTTVGNQTLFLILWFVTKHEKKSLLKHKVT